MQRLATFLEKQEALDRIGRKINEKVNSVLEGTGRKEQLTSFLNGAWLGHPLHPALVTIPAGAFAIAALLDVLSLPRGRASGAATPAIAVGVLGGLAAAPAGLADWKDLTDQQRRVGLGHAALNAGAIGFYLWSLLFRLLGGGPARLTGFLGFSLVSLSAYLGGHIVFRLQGGVAHLAHVEPPDEARFSLDAVHLEPGKPKRLEANGYPIVLSEVDGRIYALADVCTHLGCSLADGSIELDRIVCSCHGSAFALANGRVLRGPATAPVLSFEVTKSADGVSLRPST
jgi:nitrite reductase/ring-hydroxylating ferredoxin subunit/uncharacterized membrane protein